MNKTNEPRLSVTKESKSGMNERFLDNRTGETLNRTQVAKRIEQGILPGYEYYRNKNNRLIIRSKRNSSESDNLG